MKEFKVRGKNVLIKGYTKSSTPSGIILPGKKGGTIEQSRYIDKVEVLGVGPDVFDISVGDNVAVLKDTLMKLALLVNHWVLDEEELKALEDEGIFYMLVSEEDIKMVMK